MKQEYNLSKMKKRTNPFAKQLKKQKTEEDIALSNLSIASAMRGMETEDSPYIRSVGRKNYVSCFEDGKGIGIITPA
jgi:hypothetical protein